MGEATKRRKQIDEQKASLDRQERLVFDSAQALYQSFRPTAGACYRMSFFLNFYLKQEHGIATDLSVGFVNDGSDDLYASHAWIGFQEKLTDIALATPQYPELQPAGPVTMQGIVMKPGHVYTYHKTRPLEALLVIKGMIDNPQTSKLMTYNESLRLKMEATAKSDKLIRSYLDAAPDGIDYNTLKSVVKDRTKNQS